jgi:Cdc6-like AAA superfamily ATPase
LHIRSAIGTIGPRRAYSLLLRSNLFEPQSLIGLFVAWATNEEKKSQNEMTTSPVWTGALQKQLNLFVSEAWLDHQSSPRFKRAWWTAGAEEEEMAAWVERSFSGEDASRAFFIADLCDELAQQLCVFLSPIFAEKNRPTRAETALNGLAAALESVSEYGKTTSAARNQLLGIVDQFPQIVQELRRPGWQGDFLPYCMSDKLDSILTSSPLREGYLRPLFSMVALSVAAFGDFDIAQFDYQMKAFVKHVSVTSGVNSSHLLAVIESVDKQLSAIDVADTEPRRGDEITRLMRQAISDRSAVEPGNEVKVVRTGERKPESHGISPKPPAKLDIEFDKIISELTEMVGLDAVKKEVISLANYIKVRRLREAQNLKQPPVSLHLVFSGSPGTGKTTVARTVADLYKSLGVLSSGHLVETDRSGLVVGHVGGTAIKTKEVVESAIGGVLFIDEAYSLVKDAQPWDFGPEAIETLLKLMEDHRERLVVIVAGYTEPMADFIASNPGLQSRFTRRIEFQDYTAQEMLQIFERRAADHNFELASDAIEGLLEYFESVAGDDGFGNGRGVRNVFEASTMRHANRIASMAQPTYRDLTILTEADVRTQPNAREVALMDDSAGGCSEIRINDVIPRSEPTFDMGDRVFHQKFGYGVISKIDGNKLSIEFEKAGPRRVVDSFVEKILDNA